MNLAKIKTQVLLGLCLVFLGFPSCKQKTEDQDKNLVQNETSPAKDSSFFRISLAQWSLHSLIFENKLDPMDFAKTANEMGFEGIEYVSTFYSEGIKNAENPEKELQTILDSLKAKSEQYNVENVLIMVDGEGDLAVNDSVARNTAVDNHKKWVDAAKFLGCHSIRVNLFGSSDPEEWKENSVDGLTKLSRYAAEKDINILVENHGQLSSNADLLVEVMKNVNMENCGTLPDFGNFCLKREGDARWDAPCVEEYPRYEGVKKMMPYAKAVSAKSYSFNNENQEDLIDYRKMLEIVKNGGYKGFIGIEFEGEDIPPKEGIMKTRNLIIEASKKN